MDIEVTSAGFLKRYLPNPISLPGSEWTGKDLDQLLSSLGIPSNIATVVLVNGNRRPKSYLLQAGDVVKLLPLMTGG